MAPFRRILQALPYDGWGPWPEPSPAGRLVRRHLAIARGRRFSAPWRSLLVTVLRLLWLGYAPEAARRAVRRHRPAAPWRAWGRAVWRGWAFGCHPDHTVGAGAPPVPATRVGMLDDGHWMRLWTVLGDPAEAALARDKLALAEHIGRLGIPTPELLGEIPQGAAVHPADLPWPPDSALFVKPRHGCRGGGAASLRRLARDDYLLDGGRVVGAEALARLLGNDAAVDSLLVQPLLRPSPATLDLSRRAPVELRITTARRAGGDSFVAGCWVRLRPPNKKGRALFVPVDPATGLMDHGFTLAEPERRHAAVPWNGAPLHGRPVPAYGASVALVLRASAALPGLPVIGWDVLPTDQGPVVLEANTGLSWDLIHLWHARAGQPSVLLPAILAWLAPAGQ